VPTAILQYFAGSELKTNINCRTLFWKAAKNWIQFRLSHHRTKSSLSTSHPSAIHTVSTSYI